MEHHPSSHQNSYTLNHVLTNLAIGGAVIGAGIILAPHVLPAIGIGGATTAQESMAMLHGYPGFTGTGVAGFANRILESVPFIGSKLAEGGLFNAAATAVTGIGGVLLGNNLEQSGFTWGKAIRYAALATSALIAMPTVLTALGAGLIFLSTFAGNIDFSLSTISMVDKTLGSMGGTGGSTLGTSGLFAAIPHFLTCGASILPVALNADITRKKRADSFAERLREESGQQQAIGHAV